MMHNIFARDPINCICTGPFWCPGFSKSRKVLWWYQKMYFAGANAFDNNVVVQIFPFSSSVALPPETFLVILNDSSRFTCYEICRDLAEKCANSLRRKMMMRLAEICKFTTNAIYHQVEKQLQFNGNGVIFRLISSFFWRTGMIAMLPMIKLNDSLSKFKIQFLLKKCYGSNFYIALWKDFGKSFTVSALIVVFFEHLALALLQDSVHYLHLEFMHAYFWNSAWHMHMSTKANGIPFVTWIAPYYL